jgi:hypothetical protein
LKIAFSFFFLFFEGEGWGESKESWSQHFVITAMPAPTSNTKLQAVDQARNIYHRNKRVATREEVESPPTKRIAKNAKPFTRHTKKPHRLELPWHHDARFWSQIDERSPDGAAGGQNEHQALRRLIGEKEMPRGEAMERGDSSGLSEPPDSSDEKENSEDEEEEARTRATTDDQPYYARTQTAEGWKAPRNFSTEAGNLKGDNIFDTEDRPGEGHSRGPSQRRRKTWAKV